MSTDHLPQTKKELELLDLKLRVGAPIQWCYKNSSRWHFVTLGSPPLWTWGNAIRFRIKPCANTTPTTPKTNSSSSS